MKPKPTHGGKRQNAGRKCDGPLPVVTRSVSMPTPVWDALDAARGKMSRGKFIAGKIGKRSVTRSKSAG